MFYPEFWITSHQPIRTIRSDNSTQVQQLHQDCISQKYNRIHLQVQVCGLVAMRRDILRVQVSRLQRALAYLDSHGDHIDYLNGQISCQVHIELLITNLTRDPCAEN